MPKLIANLAIAVLLMLCETLAYAACAQVDGVAVAGLNEALRLADARVLQSANVWRHVATLRSVYARISAVAGIRPALIVCSESELGLNALAIGNSYVGLVAFDRPMLDLLNGNVDEVAAVMAHEFSHLLLDHLKQKSDASSNLLSWAEAVARKRYEQTEDSASAIQVGRAFFALESARFSRAIEREADEKGFSLAITLAHFSGDGFKTFALKLSKLPQTDRPPYLDDHPGWVERFDQADILTLNQH